MNIYVDFDDCLCETARPSSAYDASREWLNQHGLEKVNLYCLNKYGRDNFIKGSSFPNANYKRCTGWEMINTQLQNSCK